MKTELTKEQKSYLTLKLDKERKAIRDLINKLEEEYDMINDIFNQLNCELDCYNILNQEKDESNKKTDM